MPQRKDWIKKMNLKKGAYRSYIYKRFGDSGFDREGRIKPSISRRIVKNKAEDPHVRKMANLHLVFLNMKKRG